MNYEEKEMDIFSRVYAATVSSWDDSYCLRAAEKAVESFRKAFPKRIYLAKSNPTISVTLQEFTTKIVGPTATTKLSVIPLALKDIVGFTDLTEAINCTFLSKEESLFVAAFKIKTLIFMNDGRKLFLLDDWEYIDDMCHLYHLPWAEHVILIPITELSKSDELEKLYGQIANKINTYRKQKST